MTDQTRRGARHILAGVDGSTAALKAVIWAAAEADRRNMSLRLINICDVSSAGYGRFVTATDTVFTRIEDAGREALAAAEQRVTKHFPQVPTTSIQRIGAPVPELLAQTAEAHLTVVGANGLGGFSSMILGSVAMALVTHGHGPVAVIRGRCEQGTVPRTGPVVVGVDVGGSSEAAIAWAFDEASHRGSALIAVHAWTAYPNVYAHSYAMEAGIDMEAEATTEEAAFAERLAGWQEKYPDVPVRRVLRPGRAAGTVLEHADDAQLVVVGSRGHGEVTGAFFGPVSRALLHRAPCPVLVARNHD